MSSARIDFVSSLFWIDLKIPWPRLRVLTSCFGLIEPYRDWCRNRILLDRSRNKVTIFLQARHRTDFVGFDDQSRMQFWTCKTTLQTRFGIIFVVESFE